MKHDKPISRCEGCGRTLFSTMTRCRSCIATESPPVPQYRCEDCGIILMADMKRCRPCESKRYSAPVTQADSAPDLVNHPPHYTAAGIECIDAIQAALTPEEFRGFCKGNAMKYEWRERHKGGDQDLAKAAWYLNRLTSKL